MRLQTESQVTISNRADVGVNVRIQLILFSLIVFLVTSCGSAFDADEIQDAKATRIIYGAEATREAVRFQRESNDQELELQATLQAVKVTAAVANIEADARVKQRFASSVGTGINVLSWSVALTVPFLALGLGMYFLLRLRISVRAASDQAWNVKLPTVKGLPGLVLRDGMLIDPLTGQARPLGQSVDARGPRPAILARILEASVYTEMLRGVAKDTKNPQPADNVGSLPVAIPTLVIDETSTVFE